MASQTLRTNTHRMSVVPSKMLVYSVTLLPYSRVPFVVLLQYPLQQLKTLMYQLEIAQDMFCHNTMLQGLMGMLITCNTTMYQYLHVYFFTNFVKSGLIQKLMMWN